MVGVDGAAGRETAGNRVRWSRQSVSQSASAGGTVPTTVPRKGVGRPVQPPGAPRPSVTPQTAEENDVC